MLPDLQRPGYTASSSRAPSSSGEVAAAKVRRSRDETPHPAPRSPRSPRPVRIALTGIPRQDRRTAQRRSPLALVRSISLVIYILHPSLNTRNTLVKISKRLSIIALPTSGEHADCGRAQLHPECATAPQSCMRYRWGAKGATGETERASRPGESRSDSVTEEDTDSRHGFTGSTASRPAGVASRCGVSGRVYLLFPTANLCASWAFSSPASSRSIGLRTWANRRSWLWPLSCVGYQLDRRLRTAVVGGRGCVSGYLQDGFFF